MLIFRSVKPLKRFLKLLRKQGKKSGFVPTMGALHQGHLSLVGVAKKHNDICVASIFVNPTQFNDKEDLKKYPRTIESDIEKLEAAGCDVLFLPSVDEIYPKGMNTKVKTDFGFLLQTMEAVFRHGHFEGVAQVVKRLLDIVEPDTLYLGQKDYQQFMVVKKMLEDLKMPVVLKMGMTVREPDGLAMSSRNLRLKNDERKAAKRISQALFKAKATIKSVPLTDIRKSALQELSNNGLIQPEYFEIVDADTLKPVEKIATKQKIAICVAARVGNIRLIDNLIIS